MTAFHRPAAPALIAPLVLSLGLGAASAQEFRLLGGGQFVEISGAIEEGAAVRFADLLGDNPQLVGVRLNSPGGSADDAYRMADQISLRALSTYIASDAVCASSCALLFFAGYDRLGEGALGVHRVESSSPTSYSFSSQGDEQGTFLALIMEQAEEFGVPWHVRQHLLATPPTDLHWVTGDDFERQSLNRDQPGDARTHSVDWPPPFDRSIRFSEHPATEWLTGNAILPEFEDEEDWFGMRPYILAAAEDGPDFAGTVSVSRVWCGAGCHAFTFFDLTTGEFLEPFGGEVHWQVAIDYRLDSRLLKVRWNEGTRCIEQDVLLEDGTWTLLAERSFRRLYSDWLYHVSVDECSPLD